MRDYEQSRFRERLRLRLLILAVVALGWTGLLGYRLYQVQVVQGGEYLRQSLAQQQGFIEITPRRGEILDRTLSPLAVSVPVETICAQPPQVGDARAAAQLLAPILQADVEDLHSKLASDKGFVYLARKVSPQVAEAVLDLGLPGIFSRQENRRYYPSRELAAHVLGFVGDDGTGLSGLEYRYQDELQGEKVRVNIKVDARRRRYASEVVDASTRGNNLVLTLDKGLQFIAEQVLRETVEKHHAKNGSAILMDPESGAVLAMASYPGFNPNDYGGEAKEHFRNRAVRAIYEPGSTFKILSLAAVLNEGLVDPGELIDCTVGTVALGGKVYREASYKSYGTLSFDQVVAKSSNVGTIKLTLRLGENALYDYLRLYGFGSKTGIDLPGEEGGILRPVDRWSKLSLGALSIGQEVGVTPLQVVSAVSAVANGGFKVQPHLVSRIVSPAGKLLWQRDLQHRRLLRRQTADRMKEALQLVVEKGTGTSSQLDGYTSAGKTGTAQKFVDGAYSHSKYIPSFVGFAPARDPVLAGVVVIDEPRGKYYASEVVAPAFREMMQRALIHMQVPKDAPRRPEVKHKDRLRMAASMELREAGGLYVEGLQKRAPEAEPLQRGEGRTVQVPDFSGLSMREVLSRSGRIGLRMRAVGRGVAVAQSPPAGSYLAPDSSFQVHFSLRGPNEDKDAVERTHVAGPGGHRP